jgi:hypothetical protein
LKGTIMEMFEKASRLQLRFQSAKGLLTTEDLWQLPLAGRTPTTLDAVCVALHRERQAAPSTVTSFVEPTKGASDKDEIELRWAIAKHILDTRVAEENAKKDAQKRREQRQKIMEIIEAKEGQALSEKSVEELRAMLGQD